MHLQHWADLPAAFDLLKTPLPDAKALSATETEKALRDQRELTVMDDVEPFLR